MVDSLTLTMIGLISVLGGYVLTSFLLLKYPRLVHKRKRLPFRAVHISHRGGAGENLENTITAFQHALDQGTDMLEIDCHLTLDSQVVVSHDNCLQRSTGHDIKISETLYQDLPPLRHALPLDFMKGHVTTCRNTDRRIPLLREVFEKFPDVPVNIDIKINNDELIQKVSDLTVEFRREELTIWGNLNGIITSKCYQQNPRVPLLFSLRRVVFLLAMYYTGLLPFVPLRESTFEILMGDPLFRMDYFQRQRWHIRTLLRIADKMLMRPSLFQHLSARGIQIYIFVLNLDEDYEKAYRTGATGVMTDFPSQLRSFLSEHPQYETERHPRHATGSQVEYQTKQDPNKH